MLDAFRIADDTLRQGIQGVTDLITIPGLINLDFADIRTVMKDAGTAMMGIGIATGDSRALDAAQQAINSNLLEASIAGASRILFSIAGGPELALSEVDEAARVVEACADENANIIYGQIASRLLQLVLRQIITKQRWISRAKIICLRQPLIPIPQASIMHHSSPFRCIQPLLNPVLRMKTTSQIF